jgi:3D (Asp-Asp-Asp) domain-containing protein
MWRMSLSSACNGYVSEASDAGAQAAVGATGKGGNRRVRPFSLIRARETANLDFVRAAFRPNRLARRLLSQWRRRWRLVTWCVIVGVVVVGTSRCAGNRPPGTPGAKRSTPGEAAFTATAYCSGTVTATGAKPMEQKTIAADPAVLPMGSRIRLTGLDRRYNRVYTVMDTGSKIRGRRIDLYMRDCREAIAFGRRTARVSILR